MANEAGDVRYWEYVGFDERVYTNVPVTVNRHDVIKWPEIPAEDGAWRECDALNVENGDRTVKAPDNAEPAAMISAPEVEE